MPRVLEKEKRRAHCADVGSHLIHCLKSLQQRHDSFFMKCFLVNGDVRIELVTDKIEKPPAETAVLFEMLRELRVLIGEGGLHGNVF
ncbi:Alanine--glyoxylate aminotransferase 2-like protein [Thalictrum thalictroides]|uniref:Alanine--glyoxylate aminotransferase 2-like protein n=1 Tax=Thalictrum thalictroides TaxID=46969 RepID=A0A7J6UZV1_THATH|nr:Alanine--glyoxylate aminotransferase 2-like protein [Thalictrum thalictroides]